MSLRSTRALLPDRDRLLETTAAFGEEARQPRRFGHVGAPGRLGQPVLPLGLVGPSEGCQHVAGERQVRRCRCGRENGGHDVQRAAKVAVGRGHARQAGPRERMSGKHVAGMGELATGVRDRPISRYRWPSCA